MLFSAYLLEKINSVPSFEILGGSLILLGFLTYCTRNYNYDVSRNGDIGTCACEFFVGLVFLLHPLETENNLFVFGLMILIGLVGGLSIEVFSLRQRINSMNSNRTKS